MYFDPFRNRWAALALAGLILLAAATLVGSEGSGGPLDRMAERQGAREPEPPQLTEMLEEVASPELPPVERELGELIDGGSFTPDTELIDNAQGFDATPPIVHEGPDGDPIFEGGGEAPMLPFDVEGPES